MTAPISIPIPNYYAGRHVITMQEIHLIHGHLIHNKVNSAKHILLALATDQISLLEFLDEGYVVFRIP